jgi:hypothetical protein
MRGQPSLGLDQGMDTYLNVLVGVDRVRTSREHPFAGPVMK